MVIKYFYIFSTILFTVYGQIVLKIRIVRYGELPAAFNEKLVFLFKLFLDPWIISGFASAFIASLFWMAAMTKFEVSFAYPFMSLSFILVFLLSVYIFGETMTLGKILGLVLIIGGIIISVKL